MQKLGAKRLAEHVISSLIYAVTLFVQGEAGKGLERILTLLPQGQVNVETTVAQIETRPIADLTDLRQKLDSCMADVNWNIKIATSDTHNGNHNLKMKTNETYSDLDERLEDLQERIQTIY